MSNGYNLPLLWHFREKANECDFYQSHLFDILYEYFFFHLCL